MFLRLSMCAKGLKTSVSKNLLQLLTLEKRLNIHNIKTLKSFADKVKIVRKDLKQLLVKLKKQNKTVVGYGAPAKGNILLNYCGIDNSLIDHLTDNIPYKHGLYSPGTHLQVFPQETIYEQRPDYLLLLAWNFKKEILNKLNDYRKQGGKIIIPIPKVEII